MKKLTWIILFIACFVKQETFGQQVHHFTRGLIVGSSPRYGREAVYTDQLAFQLYNQQLQRPVEGQAFGKLDSGNDLKWEPISTDTANRFRNRGGGTGGYLYLSYTSNRERVALLNIKGNSAVFFNGEAHTGDPYLSGWMYIPVKLRKGINDLYVRGQNVSADLIFPDKPILLNTEDPTLPNVLTDRQGRNFQGAIVVINTTDEDLNNYQITSFFAGKEIVTSIPTVPAGSTRKVIFNFEPGHKLLKGKHSCSISLRFKGKVIDTKTITIEAVEPSEKYMDTFVSGIDGSLQYYAVAPQLNGTKPGSALFLSVHGAAVEAIGQAKAYQSKDWGNIVAPTNRRPRGFNWEDWGRLDALEVLKIATDKFQPDPKRIYLTGHSMGGHGTWFLGATYPDKWAAIAPCAGYPTLKGYGSADGLIPDSSGSVVGQMLLRTSNQSDVIKLATNYKPLGVYILHGDEDRTVSVNYARQMKKLLGEFHSDFNYYEYPGGSHWYGSESMDWKPIFDFFKWHSLPADSAVNKIDFKTANPGISPSYYWTSIQQQVNPLQYSRLQLNRDKKKGLISGTTENIQLLKLNLKEFGKNATISITLDGPEVLKHTTIADNDSIFLLLGANNKWSISQSPDQSRKGPHRNGTFKEAFNKRMVFVYSTNGTKEENNWSINKARYDAETWYYRSNGAVDIIPDKQYSREKYENRNVIIYGNSSTNAAWDLLLKDCPVQIERNTAIIGDKVLRGDDIGTYFIWPIKNTSANTVAVIGGSGIKGMNAAVANQYFAGGSGFPDIMIFRLGMLRSGVDDVEMAGFYTNDWKISESNIVSKNK